MGSVAASAAVRRALAPSNTGHTPTDSQYSQSAVSPNWESVWRDREASERSADGPRPYLFSARSAAVPAAATSARTLESENAAALGLSHIAAPEDGRTPLNRYPRPQRVGRLRRAGKGRCFRTRQPAANRDGSRSNATRRPSKTQSNVHWVSRSKKNWRFTKR